MTRPRNAIETSYDHCRRVNRQAGSNFLAGFLLLPRPKRRAMEALYAFMRHTDDLADAPANDSLRSLALARWREALRENLSGGNAHDHSPIFPALADAVARFHIPHESLFAVIDGVEMDLRGEPPETFEELQAYCERVASAVGVACIHIWGFRGQEAIEPARQAGIALQLTNILRDLSEDAEQGRLYLPKVELQNGRYSLQDILAKRDNSSFRELMALQIARAKQFYRGGAALWDWLDPDGRRIFGLITATYRTLLEKIERHPAVVFERRVRLSWPEKLRLMARWSLLPPRKENLLP